MKRTLKLYSDLSEFHKEVFPFLQKDEAENGLIMGLIESASQPSFMATVTEGQEMISAAFYNERHLILAQGPKYSVNLGNTKNHENEEIRQKIWEQVALSASRQGICFPGVVGPAQDVEFFTQSWLRLNRGRAILAMNQRLYKLTQVNLPCGMIGRPRVVGPEDETLFLSWVDAFERAVDPNETYDPEQSLARARMRLASRSVYFWEVGGQPVTMAGLARPTLHGITVILVYTPPEHRGKGYATALVAFLSDLALKSGKKFCVLYADLANPISNSIYQKIGYKAVSDSVKIRFTNQ